MELYHEFSLAFDRDNVSFLMPANVVLKVTRTRNSYIHADFVLVISKRKPAHTNVGPLRVTSVVTIVLSYVHRAFAHV
jgi:hypothetical protein